MMWFEFEELVQTTSSTVIIEPMYHVRYNPNRATPLLFALGGFSVDMYWLAGFTELNRLADREDIIIVYGHPEWKTLETLMYSLGTHTKKPTKEIG